MTGRRGFFQTYCPPQVVVIPCSPPPIQIVGCPPVSAMVSSPPAFPGVPPSPITPTEPLTTADRLLLHLREQAIARQIPGREYADLIPIIERETGQAAGAAPEGIALATHLTASAIETALRGLTPHITPTNGVAGEFNRVITFSVPANSGILSLNVYGVEAPNSPFTGPFWITDRFNPDTAHSIRHYNRYELHVRREGDQLRYTVALTHGFVGGMRISVGGNSFLILSHQAPPAAPRVDTPLAAPRLAVSPPPLPPDLIDTGADSGGGLPPSATLASTGPPAAALPSLGGDPPAGSGGTTIVAAPPLPPVLNDPDLPDSGSPGPSGVARSTLPAGQPPVLDGAPPPGRSLVAAAPPLPPALGDDEPDPAAHPPIASNTTGRTPPPGQTEPHVLAAIGPRIVPPSSQAIPPLPSLPDADDPPPPPITTTVRAGDGGPGPANLALSNPEGGSPGSSNPPAVARALPPDLGDGDGGPSDPLPPSAVLAAVDRARDLFSDLSSVIAGLMPRLEGGRTQPLASAPPLPPALPGESPDGSGPPPSGGMTLARLPDPSGFGNLLRDLAGISPVPDGRPLAVVRPYVPPRFFLPRYVPPLMNPERVHGLTVLGDFSIASLHIDTDALSRRIPERFYDDIVDACYVLPQGAFASFSSLHLARRDRAPHIRDTLHSLFDALYGYNMRSLPEDDGLPETQRQPDPGRGSVHGLVFRANSIVHHIETTRLAPNSAVARELLSIRARLIGVLRPLFLTQQYVDGQRLANAQPAEGAPAPQLTHPYNDLVEVTRNTFETIFRPNSALSGPMLDNFFRTVTSLDPARIEFVHNFGAQDIVALRGLIRTARTTRAHPGFETMFATSRVEPTQQLLAALLAQPDYRRIEAVEVFLRFYVGGDRFTANRAEIARIFGTLGEDPSAQRCSEVAGQLLQPFRAQFQLTANNLTALPGALDRMERYLDRVQLLLRAQEVADSTDQVCGQFLLILPSARSHGGAATDNPTNADFEERLGAALTAIDQELALLQGDTVGGAYAATRRQVLLLRRAALREHLSQEPWTDFLRGTPARVELQRRLNLHRDGLQPAALPAAPPLPLDMVTVTEEMSRLLQSGIDALSGTDVRGFLERALGRPGAR